METENKPSANEISPATPALPNPALQKYRTAAYVFLGLNVAYLVLFFMFIPPFNPSPLTWGSLLGFLVFVGWMTAWVHQGSRKTALVLTILYALRIVVSSVQVYAGEAFAAVPYVLPCLVITCYFLGRAVWDWR